jgi:hypothetical protein
MPTLHSHTHGQVAQANAQTKTWQGVCLSNRTTDRQSGRKTEGQQYEHLWYKSPLLQALNRQDVK